MPDAGARVRAFAVHVLTASGVVFDLAAVALLCAPAPDPRAVFLLLMAPVVIDAVDGPLARRWDVKRWAAGIQGRTIDDIVDYLTFTLVPMLLVWRMAWLPAPALAYAGVACMASLFGFANAGAKQEADGFFLGFPSYWNVLAIFAWLLEVTAFTCTAFVVLFSVLVFVPFKYVYPSYLRVLKRTTFALTALAAAIVTFAIFDPERGRALYLPWIALGYVVYYFALSLWLGGLHRSAR
jgi:phosphatidylcholine synthase